MSNGQECGHVLPWWEVGLGIQCGDEMPPCDLPEHHEGPHSFQVNGQRFMWETDICDDCDTPYDYCGCFIYWTASAVEARAETTEWK